MTTADRPLDVVVFGATGFVGRLTAEHLARHAPAGASIGLAGRSLQRLMAVRDGLGPAAADWELLVADTSDTASLEAMCARTAVVATTVGPYLKYGLPLVEVCARTGTHYADLTGEVLFSRKAADAHHETARSSGARIVTSCGFDSVPSDLGVLLLHERVQADAAGQLEDTTLVVESVRGGVSGGTLDSMRGVVDEIKRDAESRKVVFDPHALSPARDEEPDLGERDAVGVRYDRELGTWVAPFVMAVYNTRVVRRSNALQDWAYGRRFRYSEVMATGRSPLAPLVAAGTAVGVAGFGIGMALPPTRMVLDRVLPDPGEGPSEKTRRNGRFRIRVHTRTSTGARYDCVVAAQGDPGYAATAVMLGESALCLALDGDRLPAGAGVLTPATAMGTALADRLRAQGFTLEVTPARS